MERTTSWSEHSAIREQCLRADFKYLIPFTLSELSNDRSGTISFANKLNWHKFHSHPLYDYETWTLLADSGKEKKTQGF